MMYESKPAASAIPEKTDIAIHFPDVYFRIKSSGQKWITKKKINIKLNEGNQTRIRTRITCP